MSKMINENVELQQLVEEDIDEEPKIHNPKTKLDKKWCRCPYLGLILAMLSSLFFSLCSVIVKWLTDIDPMALAAYRYLGVLLPAIPIVIYKQEALFPDGKRVILLLRSFTGTAALMLSFYAFRHMPLADASVIVFSVPVFTGIFARIFLKEPCGLFSIFSIILTLIGVVLITRPSFLFYDTIDSLGNSQETSTIWGAVAAFSATLFGANAYVLLRALKGIHFAVIMTNFGAFALTLCVIVTYLIGGLCLPMCGMDRYLIVALAFFSFLGQILLTIALQIEQAGPVAIARSSDIVFAFIWQVLFFEEIPNRFSIAGAFLVLSSVVLTGLRKWILALPENATLRHKFRILVK
ncbi:solute carrier family 35 member G1 [Onthophagus taurus]|uniref:solute carrier family 35 member G1 n=1 Tax=Onthophagus taurus TaxID=166361 RepID=UPI000C208FCC|nr:solute carrier family 35 member G1 [Onthophagus taurus]